MVTVPFPVAPDVAFDYLTDPANRPAWQSSLRAVEDVEGEVGLGQSWVDVTAPGLRPRMRTTAYDRPSRWTETGTYRGITAELTLRFAPSGAGCTVQVDTRFRATGAWRAVLPVLLLSAPLVARTDLRAAAKRLGGR